MLHFSHTAICKTAPGGAAVLGHRVAFVRVTSGAWRFGFSARDRSGLFQFGRGSPNAHVCDPEHFGACLNVIVSGALFGFGSIGVILMTKEESAL
jgi:hypothetical protein